MSATQLYVMHINMDSNIFILLKYQCKWKPFQLQLSLKEINLQRSLMDFMETMRAKGIFLAQVGLLIILKM